MIARWVVRQTVALLVFSTHLRWMAAGLLIAGLVLHVLGKSAGAQEARWKELSSQALELDRQGRYKEEIPVAQDALRAAEYSFGAESKEIADAANNLGLAYLAASQYSEA